MVRLLVVDNDYQAVGPITRALSTEGYSVAHVPDGYTAIEKIKKDPPDLLLLDMSLPGLNGLEVCKFIRNKGIDFPIVMSGFDDSDLVAGLAVGADDFIRKPISASELIARLRALVRRTALADVSEIKIGSVSLNRKSHICSVDGTVISLTCTEFDLLDYLMRNHDRAVKRSTMIRDIWETNWLGSTKNIDMHISTLRKKLGPGAIYLQTVRGVGFRFSETIAS